MLSIIAQIISTIVFAYLLFSTLYLLMLAIAGCLRKPGTYAPESRKMNIAVLIPAYKEDSVIIDTAVQASLHNYPENNFKVFVIADQLKQETIISLRKIPVQVIEVKFETSMKAKSLNKALNEIDDTKYDIALVLDADNIMEKDCLEKVNTAFINGYRVVQCHRTAKNKQTPVALLDAASEEINNHLFRKGQRTLKLPSSLIGSGIAFQFSLVKDIFNTPSILHNPGEDREIDIQLVKRGIDIEFLDSAFIYDEKVANAAVFEKQRVRWIEAQVNHIKRFLSPEMKPYRFSRIYVHKLLQCFLLPRLLYIMIYGLIITLTITEYFTHKTILHPISYWWIAMCGIYLFVLLISLPKTFYSTATLKAVIQLPKLAFSMIKSILGIKSNRKNFIHTPKTYVAK